MKGKGMEGIKSPVIASEGNNQHVIARRQYPQINNKKMTL
jgi:hypothetical protein